MVNFTDPVKGLCSSLRSIPGSLSNVTVKRQQLAVDDCEQSTPRSPGGASDGDAQPDQDASEADGEVARSLWRARLLQTVVLYSGVFVLGVQWGLLGPTLPDLELLTGGSTSAISLILTGRNIAAVLGNICGGFAIDRFNKWLMLSLGLSLMGGLLATCPWPANVLGLTVLLTPAGFAAGFYDTCVNVAVLSVWRTGTGPWIQAMECIDAIGSFCIPLLCEPFLAERLYISGKNTTGNDVIHIQDGDLNMTLEDNSHIPSSKIRRYSQPDKNRTSVMLNGANMHEVRTLGFLELLEFSSSNPSLNGSDVTGYTPSSSSHSNSTLPVFDVDSNDVIFGDTQIMFVYLIVGMMLIFTAGGHFILFLCGDRQLRVTHAATKCKAERSMSAEPQQPSKAILFFMLPLFCFSYCAIESGYGHYLATFTLKHLEWDNRKRVAVTSAFWGAYAIGTGVGIIIIKYVRLQVLLFFDVCLCVLAQLALVCFLDVYPDIIWGVVVAVGVSISTIFATVFTWAQIYVGMSGRVNALLTMGTSLGDMSSPALIGLLIDRYGPWSWVYCMLGASLVTLAVLITMQTIGSRFGPHKPQISDIQASEAERPMLDSSSSSSNSSHMINMQMSVEGETKERGRESLIRA